MYVRSGRSERTAEAQPATAQSILPITRTSSGLRTRRRSSSSAVIGYRGTTALQRAAYAS